ncbi:MAG: hypothetical protein C4303_00100 [candidate division GAL15 bacterium]
MPTFEYVARDSAGCVVRGRILADDPGQAAAALRARGLYLTSARPSQDRCTQQALSTSQLAEFAHHMAILLGAGFTASAALQALHEHLEDPSLRAFTRALQEEVESGRSLSRSLQRVGANLPPVLVGIVESGEATGRLDLAFGRASAYLERELRFRRRVRDSLAYPAVVLGVAALVVTAFLLYVVPAFERVYRAAGASLPPLTQGLLGVSRAARWLVPLVVATGAVGLVPSVRQKVGSHLAGLLGPMAERTPHVGRLVRCARSVRFLHSLGMALSSGVPLLSALEVAVRSAGCARWLEPLREHVQQGGRLSEALRATGELPAVAIRLVALGEESGQVGELMLQAAEVLDREFEFRVRRLLLALEPALTVALAAVVGVLLLALYLPIFGLGRAVLRH